MLEIKSHSTKAGKGSKRTALGAKEFHPSQTTVHKKITKKNPIVPTCFVIHRASLSRRDNFCFTSILALRIGLRMAFSSINVFGAWSFIAVFLGGK